MTGNSSARRRRKGISLISLIVVIAVLLLAAVAGTILYEKSEEKSIPDSEPSSGALGRSNEATSPPKRQATRGPESNEAYDKITSLIAEGKLSEAWGLLHQYIAGHKTDIEARTALVLLQQLMAARESFDDVKTKTQSAFDKSELGTLVQAARDLRNRLIEISIPPTPRFEPLRKAREDLLKNMRGIEGPVIVLKELAAADEAWAVGDYPREFRHLSRAAELNKSILPRARQCALLIDGKNLYSTGRYGESLRRLADISPDDRHYAVARQLALIVKKEEREREYVSTLNAAVGSLDWARAESATSGILERKGLSERTYLIAGFANDLVLHIKRYSAAKGDLASMCKSVQEISGAYDSLVEAGVDRASTERFRLWTEGEEKRIRGRVRDFVLEQERTIVRLKEDYDDVRPITVKEVNSWALKTDFSKVSPRIKKLNKLCLETEKLSGVVPLLDEKDKLDRETMIKRQRTDVTKVCKAVFDRAYILKVQYNETGLAKKLYEVCASFPHDYEWNNYPAQAKKRLGELEKQETE